MHRFFSFVLVLLSVTFVSGMTNIYNRQLSSMESDRLKTLSECEPEQIADRFKKCSRNVILESKVIDANLSTLINRVASNPQGRNILSFVIAKIEPTVECGQSLRTISEVLSESSTESVACALNFLDELFSFSNAQELLMKLSIVKMACDNLLKDPRKFTCNRNNDVFKKFGEQQNSIKAFFSTHLEIIKRIIDDISSLLFERTFELAVGENMFYHYHNRISVFLNGSIISNVVTGPVTFHLQLEAAKIFDSIVCQREEIEKDVCFVHELSHYIRKVFDGVVAGNFLTLRPKLNFLPDRYVTNALEKTFSNDEEFRNITGILVHAGSLAFDPLTEAGYVMANSRRLRNSHNVSFIPRIPISLILKIKELSGKTPDLGLDEVEYSELLNLW
ncbi:MAG: hypothetical protein IJ730_07360 [Alphaproteobacteria bacterium]|nr:hypothetical protein [Alphaproteobacteria bacterium]